MDRGPSPRWIAAAALAALLLLQLIPYGRRHLNPPVTRETTWNTPTTEALARRACFDCHSHETRWPWYASVAPLSWRIQTHVEGGRKALNFSRADRSYERAGASAETVRRGTMPPPDYVFMHPAARLTPRERQALIAGLAATFGDHPR